jgi:hypothetical protein
VKRSVREYKRDVSIKELQEVHARCHPHGGEPEEVPASPSADALTACDNPEMVITAPAAQTVKAPPANPARGDDFDRPDDDPPAGSAPIRPKGPNPPQTPKCGNALDYNNLQSSPGMQVAYYGLLGTNYFLDFSIFLNSFKKSLFKIRGSF